jgi:hypothetical protein
MPVGDEVAARLDGFREYPPELWPVLGARYCTTCVLLRPGESAVNEEAVLLQGDLPYTAEVVAGQVRELGYRLLSVRRCGSWGKEWIAELPAAQEDVGARVLVRDADVPFGQPLPYLYLGYLSADLDYSQVRTVLRHARGGDYGQYVAYRRRRGGWDGWEYAGMLRYEEGERFVQISRAQAGRLARTLGQELPEDEVLDAICVRDRARRRDVDARWKEFFAQRAGRFAGAAEAMRVDAWRAAQQPPPPEQVSMVDDRARMVAEREALPVRYGEAFPLVRFMVGTFMFNRGHPPGCGRHEFSCNRIALTTPDGIELDLTLGVSLYPLSARRFAVTPYCPAEGYQITDADFDIDARTEKLTALGYRWAEQTVSSQIFPVSRSRFRIEIRVPANAGRDVLREIGLELTFPTGQRYMTTDRWDGGSVIWCSSFVPADGPLAACDYLDGTVDVFVPDDPHLLKPVQARFLTPPDHSQRHHRGPVGFPYADRAAWTGPNPQT